MRFRIYAIVGILAAVAVLHDYAEAQNKADPVNAKCANLEHHVDARLSVVGVAADQLGGFREVGDSALEGLKTCPDSARLWYLAVRSAELLEVPFGGEAFAVYGGAKKIAADAAEHAPQSAQIATVVARFDGSVVSAQKAYDLDRNYMPARNALALALSRKGRAADALKLLQGHMAVEDRLTRARILLQHNKPEAAAAEARSALNMPLASLEEPTPSMDILRDGNEILGFALLAAGHTEEALRPLRAAAGAGSIAARSTLTKQH